ncbi:MAG: amino acid permease [Bryobacteraceae bacterium]
MLVKPTDQDDLHRFGYAQELFRSMGGFSNFAISFSIISILTGAVTLYGYGLEMGGPLEMTLGWPIATFFVLAIAASMAELCSAYPTAGAMYHWAADLGGPTCGWFVACFNIFGMMATLAAIDYSCAQFVLPFANIPASPLNLWAAFAVIMIGQGLINQYGVRLVAILNDVSVTVHIVGVFAIVAALYFLAPQQPLGFLTQAVNSNGRSPYWWVFLLGLLQAHWTYTGFDASASMSEETHDARVRAPWGILLSVAVSGVVGYFLLIGMTLSIQSLPAVLSAKDPQGNAVPPAIAVFQQALGSRFGNAMGALAALAMWFCGLSCITSSSRTLFSLARDNGTPRPDWLRHVNPKHGTPARAIWVIVIASVSAMAWGGAVPIVTSFGTVAQYIAYITPVILAFFARWTRPQWTSQAVWSLGKYGAVVNAIAIVYTVGICFILVMPPNDLAGKSLLGLVAALTLLYIFHTRKAYQGPEWSKQ